MLTSLLGYDESNQSYLRTISIFLLGWVGHTGSELLFHGSIHCWYNSGCSNTVSAKLCFHITTTTRCLHEVDSLICEWIAIAVYATQHKNVLNHLTSVQNCHHFGNFILKWAWLTDFILAKMNSVKPNENSPERKWRTTYESVTQM